MGDFIRKEMTEIVGKMQNDRVTVKFPEGYEEAFEAVQDELIQDLIEAIIATIEVKATIVHDENEDGKFTYVEIDTPDMRDMLKDDIAEYILEKR